MRYRKKPITISAYIFKDIETFLEERSREDLPHWLMEAINTSIVQVPTYISDFEGTGLYIHTLEGMHHVSKGDYIIRGVKGELYACKPDVFEMTYEKVEE